jgi:ABC-type branched-subunit amino acid transport system substrate-binding protein
MKSFPICLAIAAALLLSACSTGGGTAPSAASDEPFQYLFIGGISGAQASLAVQELAALDAKVAELNADGGILGRTVEVEILDSKSDPTEAVSVLQKRLASGDKPDLVRAGLSSTEALALLPVLTRAGIPSHSSAGSPLVDDVEAYPYNKQPGSKFSVVADMLKAYMDDQEFDDVAVLAPEDASGDSTIEAVEEAFENSDIEITDFRYNAQDLDLSVAYQRAVADAPDIIYANCLGAPCVRIVQARESIAGGTETPMIGDTSMAGSAGGPAASVPASATENLYVVVYDAQLQKEEADQTEAFADFYGGLEKAVEPSAITAAGSIWDGLSTFAAAAEETGSVEAEDLIDGINRLDFPAGFFVQWGRAKVDYEPGSAYPVLPVEALAVVAVSPQVGGLYPAVDVFQPKPGK